jgi:hypothetical protein
MASDPHAPRLGGLDQLGSLVAWTADRLGNRIGGDLVVRVGLAHQLERSWDRVVGRPCIARIAWAEEPARPSPGGPGVRSRSAA